MTPNSLFGRSIAAGDRKATASSPKSWLYAALISAALLVPCFWHATIQAGDLASHTYNAWLAQLIQRNQAPGLSLVPAWNNVLFDLALLHLGHIFGLPAAERIAVGASVLIFFWGAFAFVCSMARRIAWTTLPFLAMLAYGWTFSQGFFNYYLSVGLAFWALALIHPGEAPEPEPQRASARPPARSSTRTLKQKVWLPLMLVPLLAAASTMGNLMGPALLIAVAAYFAISKRLSARAQYALFGAAMALLLALHWYFARRAHAIFIPGSFRAYLAHFNGGDQFALFGLRYWLVSYLFLGLIAGAALADFFSSRKHRTEGAPYRLPLQLYAIFLVAGFLLPWVIFLPQYSAPLGMITERLSLITAVMACCLLGAVKPKTWHFAATTAVAALFFVFLYQDTGALDRMEQQAARLERSLPRGARVVSSIASPPGSRILIHHLVDRACIGYCFSFGNYEPPSRAFRLRAAPGNPYVIADWQATELIRTRNYEPHSEDPPLMEIYACSLGAAELCLRKLP